MMSDFASVPFCLHVSPFEIHAARFLKFTPNLTLTGKFKASERKELRKHLCKMQIVRVQKQNFMK